MSLSTVNHTVAQFLRSKAFRLQVDTIDQTAFFASEYRSLSSETRNPPELTLPPLLLNSQIRPTGPGLLTETERAFFDHNGDVWINEEGLREFTAALLELFNYHAPETPRPKTDAERVIEHDVTFTFQVTDAQPIDIDVATAVRNGAGEYMLLILNASGKVSETFYTAPNRRAERSSA